MFLILGTLFLAVRCEPSTLTYNNFLFTHCYKMLNVITVDNNGCLSHLQHTK